MKVIIVGFLLLLLVIITPESLEAAQNQFITIVNPVRISTYSTNPSGSLKNQYSQVKNRSFPATWLLTYDVLERDELVEIIRSMDDRQDIGIFLEINENFATNSGVVYQKTDSWHRANSLFLTGYEQSDRRKLIDAVFQLFKEKLGYYPTSVGSWWTDSYSLGYMQEKYGITTNLGCADQFFTDGYQIWGTYFSTPYYPSKTHTGIPATTRGNKLNVVNLQWAHRDPLNGYKTPTTRRASTYSIQDYFTLGLSDEYLSKLAEIYVSKNQNLFGQLTLGLEGDFSPKTYLEGHFVKYLNLAQLLKDEEKAEVTNMKQFAKYYFSLFPDISPTQIIYSKDLLDSNKEVYWYQSPQYRAGVSYDKNNNRSDIFDFRIYSKNIFEPFFYSKNQNIDLLMNIPSLIDTASNEQEIWNINSSVLKSAEFTKDSLTLEFDDQTKVVFSPDRVVFDKDINNLPAIFKQHPGVTQEEQSIMFDEDWFTSKYGETVSGLSPEVKNLLRQKKKVGLWVVSLVIVVLLVVKFSPKKYRITFLLTLLLILCSSIALGQKRLVKQYFISQEEIYSLNRLKSLSSGIVAISDAECFNCFYSNDYIPAVYFNQREYVSKISGMKVISLSNLINTPEKIAEIDNSKKREELKKELMEKNVKYLYFVNYGNYSEKYPFSPGDLGISKIFNNAHVEIWETKF